MTQLKITGEDWASKESMKFLNAINPQYTRHDPFVHDAIASLIRAIDKRAREKTRYEVIKECVSILNEESNTESNGSGSSEEYHVLRKTAERIGALVEMKS